MVHDDEKGSRAQRLFGLEAVYLLVAHAGLTVVTRSVINIHA